MSRFIRSTSVCAETAGADTSDTLATRRDAAMRAMMRVGSIDSSRVQTALNADRSGSAFGLKGGAAASSATSSRTPPARPDQGSEPGVWVRARYPNTRLLYSAKQKCESYSTRNDIITSQ